MKVLELSFNPIGVGMKADKEFEKLTEVYGEDIDIDENNDINTLLTKNNCNVCENFRDMFKKNKTLIHVDLSY